VQRGANEEVRRASAADAKKRRDMAQAYGAVAAHKCRPNEFNGLRPMFGDKRRAGVKKMSLRAII